MRGPAGRCATSGVGVAAGPSSVSLTGVTVTNIGTVGAAGQGVSSGGGIVTQLGPPISSFDPTLTLIGSAAHTTSPQSNTILTGTTALIQQNRTFQAVYNQSLGLRHERPVHLLQPVHQRKQRSFSASIPTPRVTWICK